LGEGRKEEHMHKGRRLRTVGIVLFVIGLALSAFMVPTAMAATEHCPEGGTKTESGSAGNSVVLAAGTVFCVKASPEATGQLTADGVTTLQGYLTQAGITNENGQTHDVSYYVVYSTPPPPPETFSICHENEDGTFDLREDLTAEELAEHEAHEGDVAPGEEGCPEPEEPIVEEECPEGQTGTPPNCVGGTRIDLPDPDDPEVADDPEDKVLGKRQVKGRALPFTGIDPAPFLALSSLLAASGASALVIARRK
jgi:hypothetical protein